MKKILWLSRHEPLPSQTSALNILVGEHIVQFDPRRFENADEILARVRETKPDEVVVVAPLSVIQRLCERGLFPLYAKMRRTKVQAEAEVTLSGRRYLCFDKFQRVTGVDLNLEDV